AHRRCDGHALLVGYINPLTYYVVRRDPGVVGLLSRFDILMSDGIAVKFAVERLCFSQLERISFDSTSLALPILAAACQRGARLMLVGGLEGVADRAAERMVAKVPGLEIVGARSGYGSTEELIESVLAVDPDVVICGM